MITLCCTQKVRKRLNLAATPPGSSPPTTALGDWYVNLVRFGRQQVVMATSERYSGGCGPGASRGALRGFAVSSLKPIAARAQVRDTASLFFFRASSTSRALIVAKSPGGMNP